MFQLLYLLGLRIAPTAGLYPGQLGLLHHAMNIGLPTMNCGIATYLNRAIGTAGLSLTGLRSWHLLAIPKFSHGVFSGIPKMDL